MQRLHRWLSGKESGCQCRRLVFDPWVDKIPWRSKWQLTLVFLSGESHGQRSLLGYSPWGLRELDMTEVTEHIRTQFNTHCWECNMHLKSAYLLNLPVMPFSSVQFSHSVVSGSSRPHEPQHARPPCPSLTPGVHPNPSPLSQWCHPTISSSVTPFPSCPKFFPASWSFPMSQLFPSDVQSIGVSASASVLPMNIQD